ncbi:hypothetical protein CCR75_003039 [Bremia lactucae]|uniref:Uncharacterized protein n=1 Tax=Bremia lactucae TaxID=4779 RepID=A0A976P039_BRELC|nr:hypothetical protein CCR75_003039 [Bremia lactucae]
MVAVRDLPFGLPKSKSSGYFVDGAQKTTTMRLMMGDCPPFDGLMISVRERFELFASRASQDVKNFVKHSH